jgi:hypothetical protein
MDGEVEVRMSEQAENVEQAAAGEDAAVVCLLPASSEAPQACPLCARVGTLTLVGDVLYCAACGYASDGVRGCT